MRYYMRISLRPLEDIWQRILISDFNKITSLLILFFEKIVSLSEDLFCTRDIETSDQCIEVYQQYVNNEQLDFFIAESRDIKWTLDVLKIELLNFEKLLKDLTMNLFFFLKKKYKGKEYKRDKHKELFLTNLQNQFEIIRSNGKYKSFFYLKNFFE